MYRATLAFLLFAATAAFANAVPAISIITPQISGPSSGAPAEHGMDQITASLNARHIPFEKVASPAAATGSTLIIAALATAPIFSTGTFNAFRQSIPANPEALAVQKLAYNGKPLWAIAGSDSRGLMYAEQDVADRIAWGADQSAPLSQLRDTIEKPDAPTRGITLFAMNRAYWESRFYNEAYWRRYLDTLAENRFDSLVVVLGYEDGGFLAPCYPYFFDTPGFPGVKMIGITPAQQQRNTAALNRLIAMCHARGINFTIGIWDHIYRGGVQNGGSPGGNDGLKQPTPNLVWGMTAANLIPYTQAALKLFLQRFPGLDGIQFRMHDESGLKPSEQPAFWKATFQTVRQTTPHMPLDLRAKGITATEIQSALDSGLKFQISTKCWMEQMGLPFHPTHINPRDQSNRRHSYADLLTYPRQYDINWQLWTGGTARIFLWGDPDYVRRFVETTHLYDGNGFEVDEPLATKMEGQPHDLPPFDLLKPSARYYDYEFERYWHFFQVFGRIGYDPNTPPEVWDREFGKRFGPGAGPALEAALHRASWILPRIVASNYPYSGFPMTAGWPEKQHLGDLPSFANATLSDVQIFENFDEEAQLLISGSETAKVRPQETSQWFADAAKDINADIATAEKTTGSRRGKEFASTVLDLKMLADLALYHSRRIPAAVSYRIYVRTKSPVALDDAITCEHSAINAWSQMVRTAGDTYAPDLMMGARTRDLCGSWKDELAMLQTGFTKLQQARLALGPDPVLPPAPRYAAINDSEFPAVYHHDPITTAPALQPLTIRVNVSAPSGIKWVQVLYRAVDQTRDYQILMMQPVDKSGDYEAVIPPSQIDPKFDFMYLIQAMDNSHHGVIYPDFQKQTPYFIVRLDRSKSG
jgi:hypothetical protein